MRYICLVAIVLALPLTASAQQRRAAGRSDTNQAEQRRGGERSGERRSDDRKSDGRGSDERRPDAKRHPSATPLPWWERQPAPWWEGKPRPRVGEEEPAGLGERQRCARPARSTAAAAAARRSTTPQPTAPAGQPSPIALLRAVRGRMCCRPTAAIFLSRFRRARSLSRPRRGQPRR